MKLGRYDDAITERESPDGPYREPPETIDPLVETVLRLRRGEGAPGMGRRKLTVREEFKVGPPVPAVP